MTTPINRLRERGFTEDQIQNYMQEKVNKLVEAGISLEQAVAHVNKRMGVVPDDMESYTKVAEAQLPKFDPEGSGYDYESAEKAGEGPDEEGHWPSIDPTTGLVLKGMSHPTIGKTLEAEEKLGYRIEKRGGRYYSVKPEDEPETVTSNTPEEMLQQTGVGVYDVAEGPEGEAAGTAITDPSQRYIDTTFTFDDALQAGYQHSIVGLQKRGKLPDVEIPNSMSVVNALGLGASQMIGDLPTFIMGSVIGAGTTLNPITAAGGGFALTEGYRKMLLDKYSRGQITSFREFWTRLDGAVISAIKAWDVGALSAGAGLATRGLATKAVNRIGLPGNVSKLAVGPAVLASEISAMTTAGAALDGRVPEWREFIDGAALVGLMKMGNYYRTKLMDIYGNQASKPTKVLTESRLDISMKEDLISSNTTTPRSYGGGPDKGKTVQTKRPTYEKAYNAMEEQISKGNTVKEAVKSFRDNISARTWHEIYTSIVDKNHPFQWRAGAKRGEVTLSNIKMRTLEGRMAAKAEHVLNQGTIKYGEKRLTDKGDSLADIIVPLKKDADTLSVYLTAQRVKELNRRGIKYTGFSKKYSDRVVRALGSKWKNIGNKVVAYNHSLIDYMRDAGMLTKEAVQSMKELGNSYIPFQRIMEAGREGGVAKGRVDVQSTLKRIVGGKQRIVDPLEAIVKNTYHTISLVERNDTMRTIARQFGKKVKGKGKSYDNAVLMLEDLGKSAQGNTIYVWEKGKRFEYKVDRSIVRAIEGLDRETSRFIRALAIPAKTLRAGAILTPEFMVRNPIRDQFVASMYSKYGYVFGYDFLRGLSSLIKKDKFYQEWVQSGSPNSTFVSWDRNFMQGQLADLYKLPVRNLAKNPTDILRVINNINPFRYPRNLDSARRMNPMAGLRWLSDLSEKGTRIGEFRRAREAGAKFKDAAYASREITQDFRRVGSMVKGLNLVTSFLNAQIQGTDRLVRAIKDNPQQTLLNAFMGVTVPSMLFSLVRNDIIKSEPDSDMAIALKEIPAWQKDLFWIVPAQDGTIYRIPKPFEVGVIFGSSAERMIDYIFETDPDADNILEYMQDEGYINSLFESMVPDVMPNIARPFYEAATNRDAFTDQPLVPAYLEGIVPELQYTAYTSEAVKNLAKNVNKVIEPLGLKDSPFITSPIMIQNLIREWSGGLGTYALNALDYTLGQAGVVLEKPYEDPAKVLADIPAVKAFVVRYPTASPASIGKFFKNADKAERRLNTIKYLAKTQIDAGDMEEQLMREGAFTLPDLRRSISTLYKLARRYHVHPTMSPEEKRQAIDDTYIQLSSLAREGNKIISTITEATKNYQAPEE